MTQIGEMIAVDASAPSSNKDKCWYCTKEPTSENRTNKLDEDPRSTSGVVDNIPENDLYNNSSQLGTSLGGKHPKWKIAVPHDPSKRCGVVPAAHHLIPGNAALKKATPLLKFMIADKGPPWDTDIGYDVNSKQNGVWLPGSYGVNPRSAVFGKKWSLYGKKTEYANAAMDSAKAQFHDAHPEYSGHVKTTLRSIATKLKMPGQKKCPVCDKDIKDKPRPPYGLVGRLNFVSGKHRAMLVGLGKKMRSTVAAGYFTSSRVKTYFGI